VPAGVAVLCAVAVPLIARSANTAARIAPEVRTVPLPAGSGRATYYTLASGGGNCSYPGPPADNLYVALGPGEYAAAAPCGGYLDVTGPMGAVRVKEGSSRYWLALLPVNHGNPLAGVEVRGTGDWQVLRRTDHNYWLAEHGAGGGPFTLRLTDAMGRQAVLRGVSLAPGKTQDSSVWMYGSAPVPRQS
jgi:expansin (peptidoglycan-binding protein)